MAESLVSGFALGLSLILAIGAQNAFVLRQGLRGEHVFAVCATCAASDALLIAIGIAGLAAAKEAFPLLETVLRWGGAAFLLAYATLAVRAALGPAEHLVPADGAPPRSLAATLGTALLLTFANPHVYIDTVMLVGGVGAKQAYPVAFGFGAAFASGVFFFSLGFGARRLRPVFSRPTSWRILEVGVAAVMTVLGLRLAAGL